MKLTITIKMDGAAFEAGGGQLPKLRNGSEPARILRELANTFDGGEMGSDERFPILDINGNVVGKAVVK